MVAKVQDRLDSGWDGTGMEVQKDGRQRCFTQREHHRATTVATAESEQGQNTRSWTIGHVVTFFIAQAKYAECCRVTVKLNQRSVFIMWMDD